MTVYIGTKHGNEKFFLIDKYHGSDYLPYYNGKCLDKVVNGTEGVMYPQFITKDVSLKYYRKTMCKVTPLYYESKCMYYISTKILKFRPLLLSEDVVKYGLNAYKFTLPGDIYNRTHPPEKDCYRNEPPLPDGLSDVSSCQYGMPMAASFPHFLYGNETLKTLVDGLKPNVEAHESYIKVEPLTGIPLEGKARSQSNLIVNKLRGFNSVLSKFSETVIPMFWAEYVSTLIIFFFSKIQKKYTNLFSASSWSSKLHTLPRLFPSCCIANCSMVLCDSRLYS